MRDDQLRVLKAAVEAERAFGVDALPRSCAARDSGWEESAASRPESRSNSVGAPRCSGAGTLDSVAQTIAVCTACGLSAGRTRTVPGQGDPAARLMFVGEAPGADEDRTGLAFVGRAGQLLTKMIGAMGLQRDEVFIANILKCRPPGNRAPAPDEIDACFHFLMDQVDLVRPEVICALGATAANVLLQRDEPIGRLRGRVFDFRGIQLVPTYHPSYLLRTPAGKAKSWQDLQVVMRLLGLSVP